MINYIWDSWTDALSYSSSIGDGIYFTGGQTVWRHLCGNETLLSGEHHGNSHMKGWGKTLGEPGLPSTGLHRVRHNWSNLAAAAAYLLGFPGGSTGKETTCQWRRLGFKPWARKIPWRRAWQPTPVFLPGEFHEQRNLVGYSPWGHKRVGHKLVTKG